jgi:ATP/ADP translocase
VLLITVLVQFVTLKLTQLLLVCVQILQTSTYIVRISWMAIAVVMPLLLAVTQLFGLAVDDFVI